MAIITKPENNKKSYDVIYIFPEKNITSQNYFNQNVLPSIKNKNVIIYADPNESYEILKEKTNSFFTEYNLSIISESIIGYSTNATNALAAYNKNFKFFGLIDPLLKNNYLNLTFNNNIKIVYNTKNWYNKQFNIKLLTKISNKIQQSNGQVEEKDLSSLDLVPYFFQKYQTILS